MAKKTMTAALEIAPIEKEIITVRIKGVTPLISHKWSQKAKQEMLDKQMNATKVKKKPAKNPVADFIGAAYWMTEEPEITMEDTPDSAMAKFQAAVDKGARWGFPVTAIKQAAVMAASRNEIDIKTTTLRGSFFIHGEGPELLAEIKGCVPEMREDMVRVGGMSKTADLRYRPMFTDWYMDLTIEYTRGGPVTAEQILNLINMGGFTCGIGEWRPEKDGSFGMFEVVLG